jgi:hypothetical protein
LFYHLIALSILGIGLVGVQQIPAFGQTYILKYVSDED